MRGRKKLSRSSFLFDGDLKYPDDMLLGLYGLAFITLFLMISQHKEVESYHISYIIFFLYLWNFAYRRAVKTISSINTKTKKC